jgi:glutamyl-tRNA reductase
VSANLEQRQHAAQGAERIVDGEVGRFETWIASQQVVPTIVALRQHFSQIARVEVDKLTALLARKELSADERDQAIRRAFELVTARLLHHPQMALKSESAEELARAVQRLFPIAAVHVDDGALQLEDVAASETISTRAAERA